MQDPLFEPITINNLQIKNRINLPAMHLNMCRNGEISDQIIQFYAERARGGVGLITVGYATVDDISGLPTCIGAHDDKYIPGLKQLADAIKTNGARTAVQLNHGGREMHSAILKGKQAIAPSAIFCRFTKETPRAMEATEIQEVINAFAQAAVRVKIAGFELIEVLAGTGYMISSFLSPLTNQRDDEYGGSLENRMRFGLEVMQAIRKAVGPHYPVVARINGTDLIPGGIGRKNSEAFGVALVEKAGVDALHINVGWHEASVPQIITSVPRGAYAYLARGFKELVDVPVISAHRINEPALARELIADGMCDMVSMGRGLIADPYLPEKVRTGREKEMIHCIACAQGCFDRIPEMKPITCLCNPRAGREKETRITQIDTPKKVMVIGGGAAGMSSALAASERGHNVTLYDKDDRLGGQLYLAAAPPGREEFAQLAKDLEHRLALSDVNVCIGQQVDEALIDAETPDVAILATGATPISIPIPGANLPHVVQAWDVLRNKVHTGRRVVIIGGGAVGVETALFLAEKGTLTGDVVKFFLVNKVEDPETIYELATRGTREVTIIEMLDKMGQDFGRTTRWTMFQDMDRRQINTKTATKAIEISPDRMIIEHDDTRESIPADTVVLAVGVKPSDHLVKILEKKNILYQVVGDARNIGQAFDAMHQGFDSGRAI